MAVDHAAAREAVLGPGKPSPPPLPPPPLFPHGSILTPDAECQNGYGSHAARRDRLVSRGDRGPLDCVLLLTSAGELLDDPACAPAD